MHIKNVPDEAPELTGESSNTFQLSIPAEIAEKNFDAPTIPNDNSSESSEEPVDVVSEQSNEVSPFVCDCIEKCKNIFLEDVIKNFDKEGLLLHFMAFMEMISSGQLSVVNMAVLLAMEMALIFTLTSTKQMRYRNDTALFWETVLSV